MSSANFSKPQITDSYSDVFSAVRDLLDSCAKFQDGTNDTNVPVGAVRFSSTNRRFEKFTGSVWNELIPKATTAYDVRVDTADKLGGVAATGYVLAPAQGQGGVRRLFRNDDVTPFNVQINYNITTFRWALKGYENDTFHANCEVGYADVAGSANALANFTNQTNTRFQTDLNTITSSGIFNVDYNVPNSPVEYSSMFSLKGIDTGLQVLGGWRNDQLWFRGWSQGGALFTPWRNIYHTGNFDPASKANFIDRSIGVGQSYVQVNRNINTDYVNNTGRPIWINVITYPYDSSGVQGLIVDNEFANYASNLELKFSSLCCIVPPGSTYKYSNNGNTAPFVVWRELR